MKIRVVDRIDECGLSLLSERLTLSDDKDCDGLLIRSTKLDKEDLGTRLLAVSRAGIGVNNIPLKECSEQGIAVFFTPGANANAVKELVVCSLFLSSRKIIKARDWQRSLQDSTDYASVLERGKSMFSGTEIAGKKIGVIGLGAIGRKVSSAADSLGMTVYGYDPFYGGNESYINICSLTDIYRDCDFITLHLPLNDQTRNIINEEAFCKMKKGVKILNFARGELVDEDDLLKALHDGTVDRYVTDFGTCRLCKEEKVIAFPHLGSVTVEAQQNCAVMAVRQLQDYLLNGNVRNSVNLPELVLDDFSDFRTCIIHDNRPDILESLIRRFNDRHIAFTVTGRNRDDLSYTVIDSDQPFGDDGFDIAGIRKIRILERQP